MNTGNRAVALLMAVPLVLALIAESAWLAAVAGPLNGFAHVNAVFDPLSAGAFVLIGLVLSRALSHRFARHWPAIALGLLLVAALAGVGLAPDSRAAFARGVAGIGDALVANPGGLVAGLALLRGIGWGHTGLPVPEDRLVRLLGGGSVAIVLSAMIGALTLEPWRSALLTSVLGYGIIFVGAAILALAFTRQAFAAGGLAAGWQRNPIWVASMLLAVLTLGAFAIVFSGQVRPTVEIIGALLLAPLTIAGLLFGWSKRGLRIAVIALAVMVILAGFSRAAAPGQGGQQSSSGTPAEHASPVETVVSIGIGGIVAIVLVILVLVLVRLWMSRSKDAFEGVVEERSIDRTPETKIRGRRRLRLGLTRAPTDAVTAYRALLTDLAQRQGVRRDVWETPREHAARLGNNNDTGLALNLLAADYALASFGDKQLSTKENVRALSRWRLLRRRLTALPDRDPDEVPPAP